MAPLIAAKAGSDDVVRPVASAFAAWQQMLGSALQWFRLLDGDAECSRQFINANAPHRAVAVVATTTLRLKCLLARVNKPFDHGGDRPE